MTVDDLIALAKKARTRAYSDGLRDNKTVTLDDVERAGVTAIVRALRDAVVEDGNCKYCVATTSMYNQLLGSEGEKVAGSTPVSTGCLDSVKGEPPASHATDPAPAVCEWTDRTTAFPMSGCNPSAAYINRNYRDGDMCPLCGKPIKFTEAK